MGVLTVQPWGMDGSGTTLPATVDLVDTFENDGELTYYRTVNASGADRIITFSALNPCSHGRLHDLVITATASSLDNFIGPFPLERFGRTVTVTVDSIVGGHTRAPVKFDFGKGNGTHIGSAGTLGARTEVFAAAHGASGPHLDDVNADGTNGNYVRISRLTYLQFHVITAGHTITIRARNPSDHAFFHDFVFTQPSGHWQIGLFDPSRFGNVVLIDYDDPSASADVDILAKTFGDMKGFGVAGTNGPAMGASPASLATFKESAGVDAGDLVNASLDGDILTGNNGNVAAWFLGSSSTNAWAKAAIRCSHGFLDDQQIALPAGILKKSLSLPVSRFGITPNLSYDDALVVQVAGVQQEEY